MARDELKRSAALAALELVEPKLTRDAVIGIGTGSTVRFFIDALAESAHKFDAAVSSSEASTAQLRALGIPVIDLNAAPSVAVYVDGADEVDASNALIKGGGGALTREKIIAASADEFICIVDDEKVVDRLGAFPLPVEVIPMARGLVARKLAGMGGSPEYRQGVVTRQRQCHSRCARPVHGRSRHAGARHQRHRRRRRQRHLRGEPSRRGAGRVPDGGAPEVRQATPRLLSRRCAAVAVCFSKRPRKRRVAQSWQRGVFRTIPPT